VYVLVEPVLCTTALYATALYATVLCATLRAQLTCLNYAFFK